MIVDDVDAGGFVHWLVYNLPAEQRGLPNDVPLGATGPNGSRQGRNGFNETGYGGPCPPVGTHTYSFRAYALDAILELAADATKSQLLAAMDGHVLMQTELLGTYTR